MKTFLLTVLFAWSTPVWDATTEPLAGVVCATLEEASVIASVQVGYSLQSTIENRTNCLFMAFEGERVAESDVFGIGNQLYTFVTIEVDGGRVYLLEEVGEGYLA